MCTSGFLSNKFPPPAAADKVPDSQDPKYKRRMPRRNLAADRRINRRSRESRDYASGCLHSAATYPTISTSSRQSQRSIPYEQAERPCPSANKRTKVLEYVRENRHWCCCRNQCCQASCRRLGPIRRDSTDPPRDSCCDSCRFAPGSRKVSPDHRNLPGPTIQQRSD